MLSNVSGTGIDLFLGTL